MASRFPQPTRTELTRRGRAEKHVLAVDDEDDIRVLLRGFLEPAGYRVAVAEDGSDGLRKFFAERPDLVLLDVKMPVMDGWTLLERIREVSDVPVIMLTALGQESDKVRGLRGGADDYLVKPFGERELLARIGALLRRAPEETESQNVYQDAALRIDFAAHQVRVRGREVHLSALEFRLLGALARNRGAVMSVDRLLDLCWSRRETTSQSVRVYVGKLRRKLEQDPARPQLIETVKEFGYRYRPPDGQ